MMQLSFWKRLLCAALTLALGVTLTACSDDDTKDDKLIPEIEVTQSLTFDCTQTQTKNLEIELNGKLNWQIKADAWIELSQTSGKGSATVAVTVPANATSRTGTITVTATGYMGATDTGTCSVRQIKEGETNTNIAEIRELVMATNPSADGKELTDAIRAMTLCGIVVSDKGGGNQQPFIVILADDTQDAGAGLALSISQSNNTFERGDIVEVSLSDASAQLFSGLLQVSTHNEPMLVGQTEPLAPIAITADKIAQYESQYVKIENTQPEASESGTWNSDSNKGNVSMETKDGKSYKIRTLQTASYAQDAIPTDKSGSIAGIAGIYNGTLQLLPCNGDDIQLTEARFTVQGNKATLAEVLEAGAGSAFEVEGVSVIATNEQGVLLQQDGARIYAFKGEAHDLAVGDVITVSGKTESRNGLLQFGKGCSFTKTGHQDITQPQPAAFSATEIEAYMKNPEVKYVTYKGTVLVSGNYVNVEIDGTSVQGSLDYMSDDFKEKYNSHNVTITGWLFGSYKTYMYTIPVEIKDEGEFEEEVPDGAIFYSTFDKELASQTFGDGGQWPFLDQFEGWINHKGSGVANVAYDFKSMSARTNQSSKGSLSLYDGSGKNNIFFSTAPNYFTIQKIAVTSQNLRLSFGAQRYAQGATNTFIKSDFVVRLSADGQLWSQALDYDFGSVADEPGEWRLATADFTLPAGTGTLYIKFEAKMSSVNRIDDVLLTPGNGGQAIEFGKEEETPLSTIAEVLAAPIDEVYKVEGQVIGTHSKGFLVKDATGTILVFKKNHGMTVGDKVTVEGATSEYGGMKQFGETSELTKNGSGSYTQPTPTDFGAAQFDAYVNNPTIQYVKYEGDLTSYQDNIYQWHYNVAVEGTNVVGSIAYPNSDLNIAGFIGRKVIITGYTVGVSGTDTKYLNTLTTSIEFAEQETMPDESQAITVKELNAKLATMNSGDALGELVAVKGYIAANNEGGALYQLLSLVDNTGEANTGIIIKGNDYTEKDLPVGTKVIVSLKYATYDLYNGLPQLKMATVFATQEKATIKVPEITDAQCGDYLGQYVKVKNLTPATSATTWVVNGKNTLGHAIESANHLGGLYHGECVALGMLPMIEDASLRRRTRAVYKKLGLPSRIRYDGDEIFEFIRHDKKTGPDGAITVVKVPRLGECRLDKVPLEDLKAIIGEGVR